MAIISKRLRIKTDDEVPPHIWETDGFGLHGIEDQCAQGAIIMSNVINNCHYSDVFSDLARVCPRFPVVTQDVIKGQTAARTTRSATARAKSLQYCAKDNV